MLNYEKKWGGLRKLNANVLVTVRESEKVQFVLVKEKEFTKNAKIVLGKDNLKWIWKWNYFKYSNV